MINQAKPILKYVSIVGCIVACIQSLVFLFVFANTWMLVFCTASVVFHLSIYYINEYGSHKIAKILYFSIILPAISVVDWLTNHQMDIHLFYIPISLIIFILNDIEKEKWNIRLYFLIIVLSFLALYE